jgi:phosphate transport system substrate-binding protein
MKRAMLGLTCVLFVLGSPSVDAASPLIRVDGSSTVFPITEAVAEEFGKTGGGKVIVGISGTGGGFKRFCRGETDISDASRPIKEKEIESCQTNGIAFIELPVAYDGLSVVVNPLNTWVDYLTVKELRQMWEAEAEGGITRWNHIRPSFPDKEILLFGPGTDSGTFDYFTEVINGKSGNSRGDYTSSEDDNILVEGVASDIGAVGYFGLAYYEQNMSRLKLVPIDDEDSTNGQGAVAPTLETVMDSTYQPLARPIFIYVSSKAYAKPEVRKFVDFYLRNAASLVEEVGYIPLLKEDYAAVLDRFQQGIRGTVFNGRRTAGIKMTELLRLNE